MKVPEHLIERGIKAIIKRKEAETGLRFKIAARPNKSAAQPERK